jgi:DNA processing protein
MTPATAVLIQLLQEFPRQQVAGAIVALGRLNSPDQALHAQQTPLGINLLQDLSLAEAHTILLHPTTRLKRHMRRRKQRIDNFGAKSKFRISGYFDDDFPSLLREIPDPPLLIYFDGNLKQLANRNVAIVGSRRCTSVGASLAREMAARLATEGIGVVSGLALGIDGAAHRGALDENGVTIAFLGASLEHLYPREHLRLGREIVDSGGALVSEYPAGTTPRPHQFPERNRLISGAAHAIVLVEASEKSGSLITARLGLEQGRDVYAMPGPVISEVSKGCHRLIKQGAGLVTSADDVLQELGWDTETRSLAHRATLSPLQTKLYGFVDSYPQTIDELMLRVTSVEILGEVEMVAQTLIELELMGFVQQSGLGYIRTS